MPLYWDESQETGWHTPGRITRLLFGSTHWVQIIWSSRAQKPGSLWPETQIYHQHGWKSFLGKESPKGTQSLLIIGQLKEDGRCYDLLSTYWSRDTFQRGLNYGHCLEDIGISGQYERQLAIQPKTSYHSSLKGSICFQNLRRIYMVLKKFPDMNACRNLTYHQAALEETVGLRLELSGRGHTQHRSGPGFHF